MSEDIIRIKKVEKLTGTYYYPQKRVWKSRWFSSSGYEWETFFLVSKTYYGVRRNEFISAFEIRNSESILEDYKNLSWAEKDCEEYIRVHHGDKIIKTWTEIDV